MPWKIPILSFEWDMEGTCPTGLHILIILIVAVCIPLSCGQDCTQNTDCTDAGQTCETAPSGSGKICSNKACTADNDCSTVTDTKCLDDLLKSPLKSCQIPTTTPIPIRTPMVRYYGLGVKHGAPCRSFPHEILEIQNSGINVEDKKNKFDSAAAASPENFDHPVCNWKISRLQCVPNREQPPPSSSGKVVYPLGTCQCLLEMGERAIWVDNTYTSKSGNTFGQCFIPAGLGESSKCGHDIVIPTGLIDTGKDTSIIAGKSANFCTPGSECRIGYKYVGTQCSCKKGHTLVKSTATCKGESGAAQRIKITFMIFYVPLVNTIFTLIRFQLKIT